MSDETPNLDSVDCRACTGKTRVTHSNAIELGTVRMIRRRRVCTSCGATYRTAEIPLEIAEDVFSGED